MRIWLLLLLSLCSAVRADDLAALCADRAAIEQVYYNHRLGQKPPFEQTLPPATLENLVRQDLKKEAVLQKIYGVVITSALLDVEVQRINTTTRAPDILAEIKAALGHDPVKFANVFAKPILVERLLRDKFENDDALHAPQRQEVERMRSRLLVARSDGAGPHEELAAGKSEILPLGGTRSATSPKTDAVVSCLVALLKAGHSNGVSETTWQLTPRPTETNVPTADEIEIRKHFGPDAQIISSPREVEKDRKFYFEDLPPDLQRVLRVQLRQPGDVSAVIETPGGFLLYVCKEKTADTLSVATLSLPKRNYEQWLAEHKGDTK